MTVDELEAYFDGVELPEGPVKIDSYSTILDAKFFVESQFRGLRSNPGIRAHDSCRTRLIEFKEWLEANKKSDP